MKPYQFERWKKIKGYVNYKISDHGRIMRTNGYKRPDNQILGTWLRGDYLFCVLCENNTRKQLSIHRLVFTHFVSKNEASMVNHKDGNKLNNHYSNLEASDASHNIRHKHILTGKKRGVCNDRGYWKASIRLDGKLIHLGTFTKKDDAYSAYKNAYKKQYGVTPW